MKDFNQDFEYFTNLILSNNNFAFSRYGDGEVALMQGKPIGINTQAYNVDKWSSPNTITKLGIDLLNTLDHTEQNYWYGIPADSDFEGNSECFDFLTSKIKNKESITFANMWINANYQKMKLFFNTLKKPVYLICNQKAKKENFPFPVIEIIPFPDDCVNYWEFNRDHFLEYLKDEIPQITNQTFFIAAGPVSEILIHHMFEINPNNQYIDVGSSIDEYVHQYITRPYMDNNTNYAHKISYFKK